MGGWWRQPMGYGECFAGKKVVPWCFVRHGEDGYHMDGNATILRGRCDHHWFAEYQPPCPSHTPDLNAIENVLYIIGRHIREHSSLASNLQDLKSCIANAWYSLEITALQKHAPSMSK
ncbi:hypothetical protein TNCV_1516901 [Trichonephila clavipes]|nr:hypothetical protein TNCV_1516901 [Trichonephila clavipes]